MTQVDRIRGDYEGEFVLGTIRGVRGFNFNPAAERLTAQVTRDYGHGRFKYAPGAINEATCAVIDYINDAKNKLSVPKWWDKSHPIPYPGCSCGFYAYFDRPDLKFEFGDEIVGVVEGTGRTEVGTKGFRTERLKIIALAVKDAAAVTPEKRRYPWYSYLFPKYPITDWISPHTTPKSELRRLLLFLAAVILVANVAMHPLHDPYRLLGAVLTWTWWFTAQRAFMPLKSKPGAWRRMRFPSRADDIARTLARVYQVPVYTSISELLEKHPTDSADDFIFEDRK